MQHNVIQSLSGKINERADQVEGMIKKIWQKLKICEALTSIHRDVMELKKDNDVLKVENVETRKRWQIWKQESMSKSDTAEDGVYVYTVWPKVLL